MAINSTSMEYPTWNELRRTQWPRGQHNYWETFMHERTVAAWNPHDGSCWIADYIPAERHYG